MHEAARMKPRERVAVSALAAVTCAASSAEAQECHNLTAGYLHSESWGKARASGNGGASLLR